MALKFILAAASLISAIYAGEVCQKNFYIEEPIDMFGSPTDLVSLNIICSQTGFPSLQITAEPQLREEISESFSLNSKVAFSLKCILNNVTSYRNTSVGVKKSPPWITQLASISDLPFGQNCTIIGCFWDHFGENEGDQHQRRFAVQRLSCITNPNECQSEANECEHICIDTDTGYECSCRDGYWLENNLHNCTDFDECASGEHTCSHLCLNTEGNYSCYCPAGYTLEADNITCSDIDECLRDSQLCQHMCINTVGSFECDCNEGFQINSDKFTCNDIDECDPEVNYDHQCDQVCVNSVGSYNCSCFPGYTPSSDKQRCLGMGECENPKLCSQACVKNSNGEDHCQCHAGYTLSEDGHNCTATPQDNQMVLYMSWAFPLAFAFFLLVLSVLISYSIVRRRKHGNVLETNSDLYDFYLTQEKLDYNYQPVDLSHGLPFDCTSLRSEVTSFHSASNTVDNLAKLSSEKTQIVLVSHDPIFSNDSGAIFSNGNDDVTTTTKASEDDDEGGKGIGGSHDALDLIGSRRLSSHNSHDSCVGSSIAGETSPDFHASTILHYPSDMSNGVFDGLTADTSVTSDYIDTGCVSEHSTLPLSSRVPQPLNQVPPSTDAGEVMNEIDKTRQQLSEPPDRDGGESCSDERLLEALEMRREKGLMTKTKDYIQATNALFTVADDGIALTSSEL